MTQWYCASSPAQGETYCWQWFDRSDGERIDVFADPIVSGVTVLHTGGSVVSCSSSGGCAIAVDSVGFVTVAPAIVEWDGFHPPAGGSVGFNIFDERWFIDDPDTPPYGHYEHLYVTALTNVIVLPDTSIDSMAYHP